MTLRYLEILGKIQTHFLVDVDLGVAVLVS